MNSKCLCKTSLGAQLWRWTGRKSMKQDWNFKVQGGTCIQSYFVVAKWVEFTQFTQFSQSWMYSTYCFSIDIIRILLCTPNFHMFGNLLSLLNLNVIEIYSLYSVLTSCSLLGLLGGCLEIWMLGDRGSSCYEINQQIFKKKKSSVHIVYSMSICSKKNTARNTA